MVRGIRVSPLGTLQSLAARITREIAQGVKKSFKEGIDVHSDDPHQAGMKPISFIRQVLAVCLYPQLLKDKSLPLDVRLRAQSLLEICDGGSVGSYSASSGLHHVKQSIADFITRRDAGVPSYANDIFICAGSQRALMVLVKLPANGEGETQTGVLTPLPCPHMLPMLLDDAGVKLVPYRLTEEAGWAVDPEELHRALKAARGHCAPRAIYISDPGNPTGHVQDRETMEKVIHFAAAEGLVLLAEEVYQDSVFGQDQEFISYKKVLFEMGEKYSERVELISFHFISAACMGECGLRGGYMEVINMDPGVNKYLRSMQATCSPPVLPQLALEVMVNPPTPGDVSYETYAQMLGVEADVLYCQRFLKEEGVCLGAGSENGQDDRNYHIRLCVLAPPTTLEEVLAHLRSFHLRLLQTFP